MLLYCNKVVRSIPITIVTIIINHSENYNNNIDHNYSHNYKYYYFRAVTCTYGFITNVLISKSLIPLWLKSQSAVESKYANVPLLSLTLLSTN